MRGLTLRGSLAVLAAGVACAPALGQEFYALAGAQYTPGLRQDSYAFSYEYLHDFTENAFATFTWLNEGHVTDHHRDGYSAQAWLRWLSDTRRLSVSVGAGPYRYYDTTYVTATGASTDAHDWGVLGSLAVHWYFSAPLVLQLRYNYAHTTTSITTDTLLIGLGYQFEGSTRPGPVVPPGHQAYPSDHDEVTAMLGNSVVNNFHSPHGVAWALEYRDRFTPSVDGVATFLDEGDTHVVKRKGVAGQLALVRDFLNCNPQCRMDVSVAGGFYFARDQDEIGERTEVLGLLTMAIRYRFADVWGARLYWYRTLTTNGRDTDVVNLGLVHSL
jgi:hypothetical protein